MTKFSLRELPAGTLKIFDKSPPSLNGEHRTWTRRLEQFDAVRQKLRPRSAGLLTRSAFAGAGVLRVGRPALRGQTPFAQHDFANRKRRGDAEFVRSRVERIPQRFKSAATFLSKNFLGPNCVGHLLFLGFECCELSSEFLADFAADFVCLREDGGIALSVNEPERRPNCQQGQKDYEDKSGRWGAHGGD